MKKWVCLLVLGVLLSAGIALAASYRVVTEEAAIRKDRKFFAPVVIKAPYGEVLQDQGRKGDWMRVTYRGKQGWVHVSAVKEQQVDWTSMRGGRAEEASRDEVALAGKGFTPEVEKSFRDQNPKMRYDLVSQVETYQVVDEELQAFIRQGRLREPGGEP